MAVEMTEEKAHEILLNSEGNLHPNFERVLIREFNKLLSVSSEESDEKKVHKTLSIEQLHAFSMKCNDGKPFSEDEIEQMQTYFKCDTDGRLTQEGFLDM